jgi:hypothetical protein
MDYIRYLGTQNDYANIINLENCRRLYLDVWERKLMELNLDSRFRCCNDDSSNHYL